MLRQVSPCRTRALSVPQQRTLSPEQHLAGLGMQSPSLASPSSAINPGFQPVPTSQKVPVDIACLSSPRTPLERPLNRDERLVREAAAVSSKSQSSSSSGYKLPPPFRQASFAYGTSSQQVNQSQDRLCCLTASKQSFLTLLQHPPLLPRSAFRPRNKW